MKLSTVFTVAVVGLTLSACGSNNPLSNRISNKIDAVMGNAKSSIEIDDGETFVVVKRNSDYQIVADNRCSPSTAKIVELQPKTKGRYQRIMYRCR